MIEGEITMTIRIRTFRTKFLTALIAAVADILQVGAAAEHASLASDQHRAHITITRKLKTCFSEVLGGLHIE